MVTVIESLKSCHPCLPPLTLQSECKALILTTIMFTFYAVLDDNQTQFLKPVLCTGNPVVMGSWGLGKVLQRKRFVGLCE